MKYILSCLGACFVLVSCSQTQLPTQSTDATSAIVLPKIYAAGSYMKTNQVACYWINTTCYDLTDGTGQSSANAIAAINGKIYIAGYRNGDGISGACLWTNDNQFSYLPNNTGSLSGANARSLFIYNGNTYIAGDYYDKISNVFVACYWVGSSLPVALIGDGTGIHDSHATGIYVDNNDIYVSGYYYDGATNYSCYWKNGGTPITLHSGSTQSFIAVNSGTTYNVNSSGNYWIGDIENDLGSWIMPSAISISSGHVYIAGSFYEGYSLGYTAGFMQDSSQYRMHMYSSVCNSIYIRNEIVYLAGQFAGKASYWVGLPVLDNGTSPTWIGYQNGTYLPEQGSTINSIFVE